MTEQQSIIIQEVIIKKYRAPDGKEFNTEFEAMNYAKECLKPRVHILFKSVLGIGNSITVECVYDNLFMAEQACESLNNMSKNTSNVSYYVTTYAVTEASETFKKAYTLGAAEKKMKDSVQKYSWGNKSNGNIFDDSQINSILLCGVDLANVNNEKIN